MKRWLKWLISGLHAILLMVLTAFWMNTDYSYGDESVLIQWSSIFKRVVLNLDEDPPRDQYLFINLAYEKALIPTEDGLGTEVITDRGKLARFFEILRKNQKDVRFTVCDVFLKGTSADDSILLEQVSGISRVVFPTHYGDDGRPEKLDLEVPHALADYRMASGGFLKFKLFQDDSLTTVPVILYESLTGKKLNRGTFYWENGRPSMNSVIIDHQIRSYEVFEQGEYPVVNLSELLLLPEEVIVREFLKNRIILMGDFNGDVHETIYGSTPGTLILLNVFLTLLKGYHLISVWWVIFMWISYTLFSRLMLFPEQEGSKLAQINWVGPLLGSMTYLSLLSVVSYLLFNIHIQVLILTLYMNLIRFLIRVKQGDWSRAQIREWAIELRETYFEFK